MVQIYGERAHRVSALGVELSGGIDPPKLERMLREILRAAALSNALLTGTLEVPKTVEGFKVVFLSKERHYDAALEEALKAESIDPERYSKQVASPLGAFVDKRGWSVRRWTAEAPFEAGALFHLMYRWIGFRVQPCLQAGHLNWICMNFFGWGMPSVTWKEKRVQRTGSTADLDSREDALWRSAKTSLYGCRTWMQDRLRAGEKFPFAKTFTSEIGLLNNELLITATITSEFLQARGELWALMEATRDKENRFEAFEKALGQTTREFDDEWIEWLLKESFAPGLAQRLSPQPVVAAKSNPAAERMLETLRDYRKRAFQGVLHWPEEVSLFEELSAQASSHALYLLQNPAQQSAWPDAHEEYPDKPGYSSKGAWAGMHSVIHFTPDPKRAVDGWMGTFYHRLPLLDPGLFGVGMGIEEHVSVLDVGSLKGPARDQAWVVWPPDGSQELPRSFAPELPNPVPGEDQSKWGYPITLQVYGPETKSELSFEMTLFSGEHSIECYYLTPTTPKFEELAPADAYCLIPKVRLDGRTTYTVTARCVETDVEQTWSFTTKP